MTRRLVRRAAHPGLDFGWRYVDAAPSASPPLMPLTRRSGPERKGGGLAWTDRRSFFRLLGATR